MRKAVIVFLATIAVVSTLIAVGVSAFSLSVSGNQQVSVTTTGKLEACTVNGVPQTVSDTSCTLSLPTLSSIGAVNTIVVTVKNTNAITETFTPTASSSNTGVATITQPSPSAIPAGQTATFTFTVTAVGQGSTSISIGIAG